MTGGGKRNQPRRHLPLDPRYHPEMQRRLILIAMAACWVGLSLNGSDALAQQVQPTAAAGQEHVWFTTRRAQPDDPISLCHHAAGAGEGYFSAQMKLTSAPEQMVAWGDRVWLVLPRDPRSETPRREVFTVQVQLDPATGWYYPVPRDRLEVVEPLPGLGELVALVGTADGPVALIWPAQWEGSGVQGGEGSIAAQRVPDGPRLMQLRNDRWRDLELPEGFEPGRSAALAAGASDGRALRLLTDSVDDAARTIVHLYNPDDESWTASSIPPSCETEWSTTKVTSSTPSRRP